MQEATAGWMAHNLCKITGMEYSHRSETKVWNKHMIKTEKETRKVRKKNKERTPVVVRNKTDVFSQEYITVRVAVQVCIT